MDVIRINKELRRILPDLLEFAAWAAVEGYPVDPTPTDYRVQEVFLKLADAVSNGEFVILTDEDQFLLIDLLNGQIDGRTQEGEEPAIIELRDWLVTGPTPGIDHRAYESPDYTSDGAI